MRTEGKGAWGLALGWVLLAAVLVWPWVCVAEPSLDVLGETRISALPATVEQGVRVEWRAGGFDVGGGAMWNLLTMSLTDLSATGKWTTEGLSLGAYSDWTVDSTLKLSGSVLPAPRIDATWLAKAEFSDLKISAATQLRADSASGATGGVTGVEKLDIAYKTDLVSFDLDVDMDLVPLELSLVNASGEGVFLERELRVLGQVVQLEGRVGFDAGAYPRQSLRSWLELDAQCLAWAFTSYTRLEDSKAGIGAQRVAVEAKLFDAALPGGQGLLNAKAGLRAPLIPAGQVDLWSSLGIESADATGEILASLRLDGFGPESVLFSGQLEGAWTMPTGHVEAHAQLDATLWERGQPGSFGLDLGIKAVREHRLSAAVAWNLEATASLAIDRDGVALRIGAAAAPMLRLAGSAL